MKKYVILSDSCCDLSKELRDKYDIGYLPMRILYEDKDYPASLDWEYVSYKDFYDLMRKGVRVKTSQVNSVEYLPVFEDYVKKGYDVLSISCSSVLSSSYKGSLVAKEDIEKRYPDAKIICIDSRNASMGLGIMCIVASKLRAENKSIEEVASYIEAHKQEFNQIATVESLNYLKRAGRVSSASAVFGGLLQVKPIIISDINGQNVATVKVKGRQNSLVKIADMFAELYEEKPYQEVYVVNADCEEDGNKLKALVESKLSGKNVTVKTGKIGPIIGASTGPGTLSVYFIGKEVTFDSNKK